MSHVDYLAVTNPSFAEDYFAAGVTKETLTKAPCYRQCQNDDLAKEWVHTHIDKRCKLSQFKYPFNDGALQICLNGNAWSVLPRKLIEDELKAGTLVELLPGTPIRRELHWHVSGALVKLLEAITKEVKIAANEL